MNTFEIGKKYYTRSICNQDCIFTVKITGRSAKTVTYEYDGEARRSKIRVDDHGEYIQPDRYSMAPVFHAEDEQEEKSPAIVEDSDQAPAPVVEDAAPSNIVTISQPADDGSLIVMIGQAVEMNCGSCFPREKGTIVGFASAPSGRIPRGGMFALVLWESRPDCPERVHLSNIHRQGWRSAGGSPLGVFVTA